MIAHNQLLLTHLLLTLKYQSLSIIARTPNYCSHASIVHDQLLRTRKYCVDSITAQLFYCSRLTFVRTQLLLTTRNHYYSYSNFFPVQMLLILKYYLHAICAHNQFLLTLHKCSFSTIIVHAQQLLILNKCSLLLNYYCSHSCIIHTQIFPPLNHCSHATITHAQLLRTPTTTHTQIFLIRNDSTHSTIAHTQLLLTRILLALI